MTAQYIRKPLEGFARGLLATTCLTAVCGFSAKATTITEGVTPAPADFPGESFGTAYMLPIGTNVVDGTVGGQLPNEGGFDGADIFEFNHLTAGAPFTFTARYNVMGEFLADNVLLTPVFSDLVQSDGTLLNEGSFPSMYTGVVPTDGNLVVGIFAEAGESCGDCTASMTHSATDLKSQQFSAEGGIPYQVTLEVGSVPSSVPEPGTLPAAGLALGAGALLWARRNRE